MALILSFAHVEMARTAKEDKRQWRVQHCKHHFFFGQCSPPPLQHQEGTGRIWRLVDSMPKYIEAVLAPRGGPTPHLI